jgi:tripartite-type tricarboxylate transporter receptor subunit TctC
MGGHIKISFLSGVSARQISDSGKARMLALAAPHRSQLLPDVQTFDELGVPGFDRVAWVMVFAPVGTPTAIVTQVSQDIDRLVKQPDLQQTLNARGMEARGGTPAEAQREMQVEHAYWGALVKEFGALSK